MPVGLEVINDSGSVLLSSSLKNYVMKSKGTVTTGALSGWQLGTSSAQLSVSASGLDKPLLAFMPRSGKMFAVGGTVSGSTVSWRFNGTSPIGTVIDYWIFDRPSASSAANVGIEIYDSSGNVTFSIQSKPLRVVDKLSSVVSETYESGRDYAAIMGSFGGLVQWEPGFPPNPGDPPDPSYYGRRWYGTTIGPWGSDGIDMDSMVYAEDLSGELSPDFSEQRNWGVNVLVVDVTNY